jgi:hypothetical protein
MPAGRSAAAEQLSAGREQAVGGEALQEADLDRLALGRLAHAGLFAQGLGRADPGAHAAHDVGVQDGPRRPERIAGGDLAHEEGDVDRGRTGGDAGRLVAEQAALGRHPRLEPVERVVQIGEILRQLLGRQAPAPDVRQCAHPRSSHPPEGRSGGLQPFRRDWNASSSKI